MADPAAPAAGYAPPKPGDPIQEVTDSDGIVHQFPASMPPDQADALVHQRYQERHPSRAPAQPTPQLPGVVPGTVQPRAGPDVPETPIPELTSDATTARAMLMLQSLRGNRAGAMGMGTVLRTDPSFQYQSKVIDELAKNKGAVEARRSAGEGVIPDYQRIQDIVRNTTDTDWEKIAGPRNATPISSWTQAPFSVEAWNAPPMYPPQAYAAYGAGAGDPEAKRIAGLQTTLMHAIDAATEANVGAGTKAQIGSDKRMELVQGLLRQIAMQPTREGAMHVAHLADDTMRQLFGTKMALAPGLRGSYENPEQITNPRLQRPELYRPETYFLDQHGMLVAPPRGIGSQEHPVEPPPDFNPTDIAQHLHPGTWFVIPNGPNKGKIGQVPKPKAVVPRAFAPDQQ